MDRISTIVFEPLLLDRDDENVSINHVSRVVRVRSCISSGKVPTIQDDGITLAGAKVLEVVVDVTI